MQDFFCVKQRNFFALFEHFAQKYPYFSKSGARREIFSLFFVIFRPFGSFCTKSRYENKYLENGHKKTPPEGGVIYIVLRVGIETHLIVILSR